MNVINKVFALVEAIAVNAPKPSTPLELALKLGINRATCSRLLKTLLDEGYIIRYSRRQGYLPGPKIVTLYNMAAFQERLLEKARPVINRCASTLKNSVLLAQIHGDKRYVLYHKNGNVNIQIALNYLSFNDIFSTATGLLLASHLSRDEQKTLHRAQKAVGGEFFEATASCSDALAELDKIRRDDFFACQKGNQWIYAFPIYENGSFTAALGISIPRGEYTATYDKKIRRVMHQAAEEISSELSAVVHTIG